jgi:hypothetical protein
MAPTKANPSLHAVLPSRFPPNATSGTSGLHLTSLCAFATCPFLIPISYGATESPIFRTMKTWFGGKHQHSLFLAYSALSIEIMYNVSLRRIFHINGTSRFEKPKLRPCPQRQCNECHVQYLAPVLATISKSKFMSNDRKEICA